MFADVDCTGQTDIRIFGGDLRLNVARQRIGGVFARRVLPVFRTAETRQLDDQEGHRRIVPFRAPVGDQRLVERIVMRISGVGAALIPDDAFDGQRRPCIDHAIVQIAMELRVFVDRRGTARLLFLQIRLFGFRSGGDLRFPISQSFFVLLVSVGGKLFLLRGIDVGVFRDLREIAFQFRGFIALLGDPRLDACAAPRRINQTNRNIQILMQLARKEIGRRAETVRHLRGADDPAAAKRIRRVFLQLVQRHTSRLIRIADFRIVGRRHFLFAILRGPAAAERLADRHFHVRLACAQPHVADDDIDQLDGIVPFLREEGERLLSGFLRSEHGAPFALRVRLDRHRFVSKRRRDILFRGSRPEKRDRRALLQHHVRREHGIESHIGHRPRDEQNRRHPQRHLLHAHTPLHG